MISKINCITIFIILIVIIIILIAFFKCKQEKLSFPKEKPSFPIEGSVLEKIIGQEKKGPYKLLLYFHGAGRYMKSISPYLHHIEKHCDSKKYKIIIVSINGLGETFNIQNHHYRNKLNTGTGKNTKKIAGCLIKPKTPPDNFPNGNGCQWTSDRDEIKYITEIIKYYKYKFAIDEVIAGGFSVGAMLCLNLLTFNIVNKIFTFSANIPFGMKTPPHDKKIKILDFHGINDNTVPGITSGCCGDTEYISKHCEQSSSYELKVGKYKDNCNNIINNNNLLKQNMKKVVKNQFNIDDNIDDIQIDKHYSCDSNTWIYYNLKDLLEKIYL